MLSHHLWLLLLLLLPHTCKQFAKAFSVSLNLDLTFTPTDRTPKQCCKFGGSFPRLMRFLSTSKTITNSFVLCASTFYIILTQELLEPSLEMLKQTKNQIQHPLLSDAGRAQSSVDPFFPEKKVHNNGKVRYSLSGRRKCPFWGNFPSRKTLPSGSTRVGKYTLWWISTNQTAIGSKVTQYPYFPPTND